MTTPSRNIGLAAALGLRPLDRIQINSPHEIREMRVAPQLGYGQLDLPFFYFQRILPNGLIEARSPGGYCVSVPPDDICDIRPGTPITVRAMPRSVFLERLRLPLKERQGPIGDECYSEAHVMAITKDRWHRVDRVFVHFLNPALNETGSPGNAPIHQEDRKKLAPLARRTNMPVMDTQGGNHSADQGLARELDLSRQIAGRFIHAALKGNQQAVTTLAGAGLEKITTAKLNRIAPPLVFG